MLALLTALVLAQAPAPVRPVTLIEGGWVATEVDPKQLALWNEVLFNELTNLGVTVRTSADIAQVLGLERQKQLLGCSDGESCTAEIASALDADGLVRGSAGRSGSSLVLNVRIVSATGDVLAARSEVVPSVDAAVAALKPLARELAQALAPRFPGRITLAPKGELRPGLSRLWWAPAAGAVVLAGLGMAAQLGARGAAADVRDGGTRFQSLAAVDQALASGRLLEQLSFVAFGLAGAAAVTSVLFVVFGDDPPPVALVPVGSGVAAMGRW